MKKILDFKQYNESVNEKMSPLQEEYREYFKCILDCYGVKSPAKLSDDKKKEFFDNVNKYWTKGKGATKDLDKIKEEICGKEEKKEVKKMRKLKTFEGFSTEGPEPRFVFTPELEQKILNMGYVKIPKSEDFWYYKNPNNKEDIAGGDRLYVEGGNIYSGGNINTRNFLAKNAKQV